MPCTAGRRLGPPKRAAFFKGKNQMRIKILMTSCLISALMLSARAGLWTDGGMVPGRRDVKRQRQRLAGGFQQ
jgi:hypothetical protein